jgi:hypothetical protein
LLEPPNDSGKSGITASIAGLLKMVADESLLGADALEILNRDFAQLKSSAANSEYNLIQSLRDFRNVQLAHSLIPWREPTNQVWAHDLIDFVDAIFHFAIQLETALADATGISLAELSTNAKAFEASAGQFWRAQTTLKFLADDEPPSGELAVEHIDQSHQGRSK